MVLHFSQSWIEGLIALCPELSGLTRMLAESVDGLEFIGVQALAHAEALVALEAQSPGQKLASCVSLLSALLQWPWRRLSTGRDCILPGGVGVSGVARINRLVRQLLTTTPVTIRHETIASSIGMTPSAFSRQFRAVTGQTFMSFVQKLRIGHACHLLATTAHGGDRYLPGSRVQKSLKLQSRVSVPARLHPASVPPAIATDYRASLHGAFPFPRRPGAPPARGISLP